MPPSLSIASAACQARLVPLLAGRRGLALACHAGADASAPRLIRPRASGWSGLMLALLAWSCLATAQPAAVQSFAQVASPIHADAVRASPPMARVAERGRLAIRSVPGNSLRHPTLPDGSRRADRIWLTQSSNVDTLSFDLLKPVASEWRTAAPRFAFAPGSFGVAMDSNSRLSLRVRHGTPTLWLQRKF